MVYTANSDNWQSILRFIPMKKLLCEVSPVSPMFKDQVDKQLKARVRTCLLTLMQNCSEMIDPTHRSDVMTKFTEIQAQILADENSSKRWRHFLRAIETTLANLPSSEVERSKLRNFSFDSSELTEMRNIGQIISDLVDSRDFWNYSLKYSRQNKSTAYLRMQSFTLNQIVQSFKNLYVKGYIEQALHFADSFKKVFQYNREYLLAYKKITLICVEQLDAPSAVVVAKLNHDKEADTIKKLALDHYLTQETEKGIPTIEFRKIDVLITLSSSLNDLDWNGQYFITFLWALMKEKRFGKVLNYFDQAEISPDPFFINMLKSSFVDWNLAYEFVTFLPTSALRERLTLILTQMNLSRLPQLTLLKPQPSPVPSITDNGEVVGRKKKLHQLAISDLERPKRSRPLLEVRTS